MNIIEKLKQFNVEITPELEKAFPGDFLSALEVDKKLNKTQTELEAWKQRAETAEKTLKGFEGKDFDTITKERDEWKRKAENAEKDYTAKIAEREKADLLKEAFAEIKFTSEAAKKSIMSQISEGITVRNGKLIGFNDLLDEVKKNDASAFVDEHQENLEINKARFTEPNKNTNGSGSTLSKKDIMSIKDSSERQAAIAKNLSLFGK